MGQQFQMSSWRGGHGERVWLSMLVNAMEEAAQPRRRAEPCDARTLKAMRAQLALPAQIPLASPFSVRN